MEQHQHCCRLHDHRRGFHHIKRCSKCQIRQMMMNFFLPAVRPHMLCRQSTSVVAWNEQSFLCCVDQTSADVPNFTVQFILVRDSRRPTVLACGMRASRMVECGKERLTFECKDRKEDIDDASDELNVCGG